jgi:amino acid transporter
MKNPSVLGRLKNLFIGRARDLSDERLHHKVFLVAILAWVGLGADGLSSSCYGPEESFKALGQHTALAPFIVLACVTTIVILCISYSQIIELFPGGGGGYLVASKLISPAAGVVSGCALLVDYVLTIALSIASGSDALFSVLPPAWQSWKLPFAVGGVLFLTVLNLRGVKESILLWVPIFFVFLSTHGIAILYAVGSHMANLPQVTANLSSDFEATRSELGWMGLLALLIRAFSVGAGTFTGIEAVSNGLPVLREPRVATGKRTMFYIALSLGLTVGGLLTAYLLYDVTPQAGKTLNAVLFERITINWPQAIGGGFVSVAMFSAMALLFIAAQAGFLDGPRVLANMAIDRWFPTRFASLSDRLVSQNGILLMGGSALMVLMATKGSVGVMVVLYSINVFITFTLSQLGMVRHWWTHRIRATAWHRKLAINGIGFGLSLFMLVMLSIAKFWEGGWVTLVITGLMIAMAYGIRRHYSSVQKGLTRLDDQLGRMLNETEIPFVGVEGEAGEVDPAAKTAVIFVNGFNGLGIHTTFKIFRMFPGVFRNFVFVQVGLVDAGNFKGAHELENLRQSIQANVNRYSAILKRHGYGAEGIGQIGTDVVETAQTILAQVAGRYPQAVFFGGQLVLEKESWITRLLHNYVALALQRECYRQGLSFVVIPVRM